MILESINSLIEESKKLEKHVFFAITQSELKLEKIKYTEQYPYTHKLLHTNLESLKQFIRENNTVKKWYYVIIPISNFEIDNSVISKNLNEISVKLPFEINIKKLTKYPLF